MMTIQNSEYAVGGRSLAALQQTYNACGTALVSDVFFEQEGGAA